MKPIRLFLCVAVSLALNASAITFNGTFTGTVTDLGSPVAFGLDSVGDTFTGTYSYDSAGVNGLFSPTSGNLQVTISFPDLTLLTQLNDGDHPNYPRLNVVGGSVNYLDFFGYSPSLDLFAGSGSKWDVLPAGGTLTQGTLEFSRPAEASTSSVPDAGGSALLLGLASLGLLAVRRQQVAA